MDDTNLGVASIYINNLLLSRGLLKNGTNINFAHPERCDGGTEGTMAKVMGLVNDLILRRDVWPSLSILPAILLEVVWHIQFNKKKANIEM